MNDIVQATQAAVPSNPQDLAAYYQKMAEAYASTERSGGSSIRINNGVMSVGDQPIPGNMFAAIVLDAVRLNTFYTESYSAANVVPPRCYAIGRDDPSMAPHPDMQKDLNYFMPQAERCAACPHNEFGSGQGGKGKSCTNRRRLLMLVAGSYAQGPNGWVLNPITDPNNYKEAAMVSMALPPTSLKGWGEYVRKVAAEYQRPMLGVITRVYLYPHPTHGREAIGFEPLATVPDEWAPHIIGRHQEAAREIMQGYEPPQQPGQPQQQQRGGGFYAAQAGG